MNSTFASRFSPEKTNNRSIPFAGGEKYKNCGKSVKFRKASGCRDLEVP
jgi:hypothetical protein